MIANVAFLAALTVFLFAAWLAGELTFLAPYKGFLFRRHGDVIGVGALLLFLNLCALYYSVARWLFLRDTGRRVLVAATKMDKLPKTRRGAALRAVEEALGLAKGEAVPFSAIEGTGTDALWARIASAASDALAPDGAGA